METRIAPGRRVPRPTPSARGDSAQWPPASAWRPSALRILGVGADDVPHQTMPDHVRVAEVAEADAFDAGQDPLDLQQSRLLAVREIDLRLVAGDHGARVHAQTREEHLHLHAGRVLRLVEDDEGIRQGAP